MNVRQLLQSVAALVMIGVTAPAWAAQEKVNSNDPLNGILDIYSATFDPPLNPGGDPFFGGTPPASRAILVVPTPTGVLENWVPCGLGNGGAPCLEPPQAGSFLDLTLSNNNSTLTIAGGTVAFPTLTLNISGTTDIIASNAGIVFDAAPQVTTVDANGVAVFEVDLTPATAVDFSTFSEIIDSCTGGLCGLVNILTLDMIRYRLTIDYDPDFVTFTADFIGQTANNSMVFATLNKGAPQISVTGLVSFGSVTESNSSTQDVTVSNAGTETLSIATITALTTPFSILADNCSGQTLAPAASCLLTVEFSPPTVGPFSSSFDISSDDPLSPTATVSVSGTGVALPVPDITVTDSVPDIRDLLIPFGTLTEAATSDQTVTVTNDGTADLILGNVTLPTSPFSIPMATDTCSGQTLASSASCTFIVRFAPVISGSFSDSVDIPSNDPDELVVTVNLTGTGVPVPTPDITVTDSVPPGDDLRIPFNNVTLSTAADQLITVTNDGTADLVIGTVAGANPLAAPFSILNETCSDATLTPSQSCTITARLRPASTGSFNDSLDIPSNDPDEPSVTVDLSGRGLEPIDDGESVDQGFFGISSADPGTLLALLLLVIGVAARRPRR